MDDILDLMKDLELPEKGISHLEDLRSKVFDLSEDGDINPTNLINEITERIGEVSHTVHGSNELPILHFLRAHCFYVEVKLIGNQNYDLAMKEIQVAVHKFGVYNSEWNEALAHCYLGLLHGRIDNFDPCLNELNIAIKILTGLKSDFAGTNNYNGLLKIKSQIHKCEEQVKRVEAWHANSVGRGSHLFQNERSIHKSIIQKHRERLKQHYDNLYNNKQKIPPTLVASLFYLYKALTPSHSVYSKIPKSVTENEQLIYENLFKKIGFFEIIEQLIALEKEFNPTASREELLEIINKEWDNDINQ